MFKWLKSLLGKKKSTTNNNTVTGDNNQGFQGINNSKINNTQTDRSTKIGRQINQGDGSTYNENN